ncbi:hypothetical protein WJ96_07185 [Burkholderia ubonensis]|uniref:Uncharacterized protein n=1 Tax=Burkholderia ubonensis TaxID=101571 RepID=A0AAW3MZA6_9BURK|nr:hypothetical protein [Burkholderia ubonensis]KVP75484.1 hypothetical protein WJ93_08980 [Burkholderia ubonensis]KVP98297.1 hypothetical protein WJ96_07185 [Burkholderia ubonensis]KVZ92995.1 hypothetical protein WL25_18845 [Burkholderia ubonensis]
MKKCIKALREFAQNVLHGGDLCGYAARDASLVLLDSWQDALREGSKDELIKDVDRVIARLQTFRAEAVKALPAENGGLADRTLDDWKARLAKKRVEIYPCPQHRIGRYGYTGCEDSDYVGEEEAIKAAVAHHFG